MSPYKPLVAVGTSVALLLGGALAGSAPALAAHTPAAFPLPAGFQPEGIDIGPGDVAYFGSRGDGSLYRADLRTGEGEVFSPAVGSASVGLEVDDRGRLFVSGGDAGTARVVDAVTGEVLASYQLATGASFVNDVVVTEEAAFFTDSVNPVVYRVPLGRFGQLPAAEDVEALPLTGDLVYDDDPATFEANGIETTPDGASLLVVQSGTGLLFRVDPATGATTEVDLGGELVTNGDGITRAGRTLYVVQNQSNTVAVVELSRRGGRGEVTDRVTDPRFDVPTTVAVTGHDLYLPNARFGVEAPETAEYTVNRVARP